MNIPVTVQVDDATIYCELYKDGTQWCVLAGDNIQEGIAGFGYTPGQAVSAFKVHYYNEI